MLTVKIDYRVHDEAYHCELSAFQYDVSKLNAEAFPELTVRYYNSPDNAAGYEAFKTFIDNSDRVIIERVIIFNAQNVEIHNSDIWKNISALQEIALGQNQMYPECTIGFMPAGWAGDVEQEENLEG